MHKYTTISSVTISYRQDANRSMRNERERLAVVSALRAFFLRFHCLHCELFALNYDVSTFLIICQKIRIIGTKDINISVICPFKRSIKVKQNKG